MFLRIDKLGIELPSSTKFDPTAAAAVQELLGGRFGEMSTLNNYLHQSVAMKAKKQLGSFYELVASITAEEVGHVELVAATINALLDQAPDDEDPDLPDVSLSPAVTFLGPFEGKFEVELLEEDIPRPAC